MTNEFKEFVNFVEETTGRYPEKLAESFQDIYIYVPFDKIPPDANVGSSRRKVSIENYFVNKNEDFRKLVYNSDWHLLENHLGSDLLRFCFKECIFAKRTKTGAYMVSNLINLKNKITSRPIERLNQIFHYAAMYREGNPSVKDDCLSNNNPETLTQLQENLDRLFLTTEMKISTDDMLYKISKSYKFPDTNVLSAKPNRKALTLYIVNPKLEYLKEAEYTNCLEPLEAVLQKLKKAHGKYNYSSAIKRLLEAEETDDRNFANELQIPILKMFFRNIFQTLIPKKLFQSNKNINIVLKVITDLLEAPKCQSVNLKSYLMKMKISDISWLKGVENVDAKWWILGRLLKWFFETYILTIFRCMFYIIVVKNYEKIYFMQQTWKKMASQFFCKMRKEKVIVNTKGLDSKTSCNGTWTLFPKKNGMRTIMVNVKGKKPSEITRIALCYLQQLYVTKYGEAGKKVFFEKWKNLVERFREGTNKTMYLVSCDIKHAYGSIDQKKLLQIVKSLAKSTRPKVTHQCYKFARDFRAVTTGYFKSRNCVTYPELEMPIASKSIFAPSSKVFEVSKELLLRVIYLNVRNQNILISGQKYLLQKGIAQGAILSAVLCDLYYSHMEEKFLSEFKTEGFLHRYVDDFLFATENKELAQRFLAHVENGFPEYNCSFNAAKTRTNLPGYKFEQKLISSDHIVYLGFKIDCETLEVSPEYAKSARYTTMLTRPEKHILVTFEQRLLNLASLKLDRLILDRKINSEDTVLDNVRQIFMRQAERCIWLLKALFDGISRYRFEIYRIIRLANRKIFIRIQRYFVANGYDFQKLELRLVSIPWAAYRQVFGKHSTIHAHFRSLFLENLKLSLRAPDSAKCYSG